MRKANGCGTVGYQHAGDRLVRRLLSLWLLLSWLAGWLCPAAVAAAPPVEDGQTAYRGATIVQGQPSDPSQAAIIAIMLAGTADQTAEEAHCAHIAEHMVFQSRQPGQPSLIDQVADWGGTLNGHTALDYTEFEVSLPTEHTLTAIEQLLAALFATDYDPVVYQRELTGYMRVELAGMTRRYPTAVHNAFRQAVFAGTTYAEQLFTLDVTTVPAERVADWQRREYGTERLVLVVNSAVPGEQVQAAVERALAAAPAGQPPRTPAVQLDPPAEATMGLVGLGAGRTVLGLAVNGVDPADRDYLALVLHLLQQQLANAFIQGVKDLPELTLVSWQGDSGYLQMGFDPNGSIGRGAPDPLTKLRAEFTAGWQHLADGEIWPGQLTLLYRIIDELAGSDEAGALSEAWGLAGDHVPGMRQVDWANFRQLEPQLLLQRLRAAATKYLPAARPVYLDLQTLPSTELGGLLVVLLACALAGGSLWLVGRRWVLGKPAVRIFLALILVTAKSAFRPGRDAGSAEDRWRLRTIQLVLAIMLIYISFQLSELLTRACLSLGHPELLFVLATASLSILLLFSGLYLMLSVFLWSIDSERLVALPLSSAQIVLARLTIVALGQYPLALLFLFPPALRYAAYLRGSPALWLTMAVVTLVVPVFSLTLVTLPIILTMRHLTSKLRERLMMIGSLLLALGGLLFRLRSGLQANQADVSELLMRQLQLRQADLTAVIGRTFPPAIWVGRALVAAGTWRGIGYLALLLVTAAGCLVLLYRLSLRCYLGSVPEGGRWRARRGRRHGEFSAGLAPVTALFWREWKLFWRTPGLLAITLPNVLAPLIALFPLLRAGGAGEQGVFMLALLRTRVGNSLLPALVAGATGVLLGVSSRVASIGISREGSRFYVSKMIPVDYRLQIQAKLLNALAINGACLLPGYLLYAGWVRPGLAGLLATLLAAVVGLFFACSLCLFHDLRAPHLDWDNPQQLLRHGGNLLPLLSMLITVGATVIVYRQASQWGWSQSVVSLLILIGYALLGWQMYRQLLQRAEESYEGVDAKVS